MSRENVEIVRAQYERWNAQDTAAWIAGFHPSVQYISSVTASLYGHGEYHGREGLRRFVDQYLETWESFRLEPLEYIPIADKVVVAMKATGRGRGSGVVVNQELAHVWTFEDGLPIRHESFLTREAALEAVGLSE